MGATDHGVQTLTYEYLEEATAEDFNKRHLNLRPRGIYSGGYLTRVSNTSVSLSSFVAEIGDDNEQIGIQTASSASLTSGTLDSGTIDIATPYLVLRWAFIPAAGNYVEVHAIATVADAQTNDIIIGKCNFTGATLVDFDYADRTFLSVQDLFFKVEISSGMNVQLRAGRIHSGAASIFVPEQVVGTFSVPGSPNARIDLVYIANDGVPTIFPGTVATSGSQVAPNYGGKLVVAEVTIYNGDSSIPVSQILDVRSHLSQPSIPDNSTIELVAGLLALKGTASLLSSNGYIKLSGGFILQWGSLVVVGGTTELVNLPLTYPTSHFWAMAMPGIDGAFTGRNENASTGALPTSVTQISVRNGYGTGSRTMYWFSIGK